MPVVLPRRAVLVLVRDAEFLHQLMSELVVLAETSVTQQGEALPVAELATLLLQQLRHLILHKVLATPEDLAGTVTARGVHHQRGIPGSGPAEHVGVTQEQRP